MSVFWPKVASISSFDFRSFIILVRALENFELFRLVLWEFCTLGVMKGVGCVFLRTLENELVTLLSLPLSSVGVTCLASATTSVRAALMPARSWVTF